MKRSISRWSALFALTLAAGTVSAVMAVPAEAATPLQVCRTVKGTATFTPGLTNTPRDNVVKAKNPLYKDLASATGQRPKWNFHKYLVDRGGKKVQSFDTRVAPEDPKLVAAIEKLLEEK